MGVVKSSEKFKTESSKGGRFNDFCGRPEAGAYKTPRSPSSDLAFLCTRFVRESVRIWVTITTMKGYYDEETYNNYYLALLGFIINYGAFCTGHLS